MSVLAVKVLLAPGFVVAASLAMRRFGPQIGGMLGGLPVVAGPILLVYALVQGRSFGADSATSSLLGLLSLTCFVVAYGLTAPHRGWRIALPAGWCAFFGSTAALTVFDAPPPALGLLIAAAGFAVGLVILRSNAAEPVASPPPPPWDLPVRALSALVLVVALTTAAGALGPELSGLLATFPVITSVLAAFTHAQQDSGEVRRLLRGMLSGFFAYALFAFTVAISIRSLGIAGAFLLGTAAAAVAQTSVFLSQPSRLVSEHGWQNRGPTC